MADGGMANSTHWIGSHNWVTFHLNLSCNLRLVLKLYFTSCTHGTGLDKRKVPVVSPSLVKAGKKACESLHLGC